MIKVVAPSDGLPVIDGRCRSWRRRHERGLPHGLLHAEASLRYADGPDEGATNAIAKLELGKHM